MHSYWKIAPFAVLALGALTRPAAADVSNAWSFDDGYTFYEIDDNQDYVDGQPVDAGWTLKANFRVFGQIANRSLFRLVLKKGNRELAQIRCEVSRTNTYRRTAQGPEFFYVESCRDRDQRIRESGDITVEIYAYDDDSEEEHLLRTHKIRVVEVPRVRGNGEPDAPRHYVDRMGEVLTSILHLQHNREEPYLGGRTMDGPNLATLTISGSPDGEHWNIRSTTHLRCKVDGQRVEIARDQVTGTQVRNVYEIHTWGQGRQDERAEYNYRAWTLRLPLTFDSAIHDSTQGENRRPPRAEWTDYARLDAHPGRWECQWRDGATVLRTFRWTVGANGRVVPHREQTAGDLSFGPNSYLVETVIPESAEDAGHDARVNARAAAERAFHGRGLRTDEGRAMAAALPTRGALEPDSSGRGARRRGRGR